MQLCGAQMAGGCTVAQRHQHCAQQTTATSQAASQQSACAAALHHAAAASCGLAGLAHLPSSLHLAHNGVPLWHSLHHRLQLLRLQPGGQAKQDSKTAHGNTNAAAAAVSTWRVQVAPSLCRGDGPVTHSTARIVVCKLSTRLIAGNPCISLLFCDAWKVATSIVHHPALSLLGRWPRAHACKHMLSC
jgi:hypothetical protein